MKKVKQIVKQNHNSRLGGGSAWESNPPETFVPPDGFEVREAHRDSTAPLDVASLMQF